MMTNSRQLFYKDNDFNYEVIDLKDRTSASSTLARPFRARALRFLNVNRKRRGSIPIILH